MQEAREGDRKALDRRRIQGPAKDRANAPADVEGLRHDADREEVASRRGAVDDGFDRGPGRPGTASEAEEGPDPDEPEFTAEPDERPDPDVGSRSWSPLRTWVRTSGGAFIHRPTMRSQRGVKAMAAWRTVRAPTAATMYRWRRS